jgi:ATP-dependent Clp protease ATP-binding subunit ClpC
MLSVPVGQRIGDFEPFTLRRTIQRLVEDPLSEKLLLKEFKAGQTIIVHTRDDEIFFEGAPIPPDTPPVELAGQES